MKTENECTLYSEPRTDEGGGGRTGVLGGNFMLGRFFCGGKVRPGFFFPRGKIYIGILFPGAILSRGGFPRGSSMRVKLYATTPVRRNFKVGNGDTARVNQCEIQKWVWAIFCFLPSWTAV